MGEFKLKETDKVQEVSPNSHDESMDNIAYFIGYFTLIFFPLGSIIGGGYFLYDSIVKLDNKPSPGQLVLSVVCIGFLVLYLACALVFLCDVLFFLYKKMSDKNKQKNSLKLTPVNSENSKTNSVAKSEGSLVEPADKKKAEAERIAKEIAEKAAAEKERVNKKIEEAKKAFDSKIASLNKLVPSKIDITPESESYDFSTCLKESGLKLYPKTKSLPSYIEWSEGSEKITILDRRSFILAKSFSLEVEISDPLIAEDSELKSKIKPQNILLQFVAKYPEPVRKFIEWAKVSHNQVRLPNVKQGIAANFNLCEILSFDSSWAELLSIEDSSGSLVLEGSKNLLTGVIKEPVNDIKINALFQCKDMPSVKHSVVLILTCTMDAEMRWKQIEKSDSDKPPQLKEDEVSELKNMYNGLKDVKPLFDLVDDFGKPNRISFRQVKAGFDLAYASIRGRSHIKDGKFREDDIKAKFFLDNKALVIVVSDGAGSAALSRRGSQIVANLGLETLVDSFEKLISQESDYFIGNTDIEALKNKVKDIFTNTISSIRQRIDLESHIINGAKPTFSKKDMYATFLAAVLIPCKDGHILFSYSVGDGAIGVGGAPDEVSGIKCVPDHGQSAGQTLFVQTDGATDANKRLNVTIIPGSFSLMLMTDGVSDPLIPLDVESSPETWHSLSKELKCCAETLDVSDAVKTETFEQRGKLCEWLDSYQPSHHDDRTIAILSYNPIS